MARRAWLRFPPVAPAVAIWLACGAVLAAVTSRVSDWFVMTDELLYERLALSVVRLHSPLPHVHGRVVPNVAQLYPLLLALPFHDGFVGHDLHRAHAFDAFVMSSAAVPAYLLTQRLTGRAWAAALAALLCVAVPWIVLSSFLLTEVAAYPAFVWAVFALQACVARPSALHDALALVALVVAILARAQLGVLVVALPLALLLAYGRDVRGLVRAHRVVAAGYALGLAATLALTATGHNVAGTYTSATGGNPLPAGVWRSLLEHLAAVAVGAGLVVPVVGGAWLVDRVRRRQPREQRAFALVAVPALLLVAVEAASYEVRFGGGVVRDRYAFYLAPLLVVAFVAALADRKLPTWSLLVPAAVLAVGLALSPLPVYEKLYADSPASIVDNYLRATLGGLDGARGFLVGTVVLAAAVTVEAGVLLRRRAAVALLAALALALACAQTSYAFVRLFRVPGTAGRPLTQDQSNVFDWVDRTVGRNARVAMVPYPIVTGDYWASVAFWWDLEFWNRSIAWNVGLPGEFEGTPSTFPKTYLRFDRLGRANVTLPGDVAQAVSDARFHLAGTVLIDDRNVFLVDPERPWRVDWTTSGLYDDGWTKPNTAGTILVYPLPGQVGAVERSLTVYAESPPTVASRPFVLSADGRAFRGAATPGGVTLGATVCVPATRAAGVRLSASGASPIYGDPRTLQSFGRPRSGGILVTRIDVSGQTHGACTLPRGTTPG
ncbi:MAG TPA: hypothetical protein VFA05_00515 [Gaiellaceae bacterium]|nr:hypothetical protein [Gaiellaceae bacterium]